MATQKKASLFEVLSSGIGSSALAESFWERHRNLGWKLPSDGVTGIRTELVRVYRRNVIDLTLLYASVMTLSYTWSLFVLGGTCINSDVAWQITAFVGINVFLIPFILVRLGFHPRGVSVRACKKFLLGMPKVMEALGIRYFKDVVHFSRHDLQRLAHTRMVHLARAVLEAQLREGPEPISVTVTPLKEHEQECCKLFVEFGLIPDAGLKTYYEEAEGEMADKEGARRQSGHVGDASVPSR